MAKNRSGYDIDYEFEYKGFQERYYYDIPFEVFMEGVRKYFSDKMVNIDGKDVDIWNALVELESYVMDNIFDSMEDWFKDRCKDDAYEGYKDYVEWEYEDELASNEYHDEEEQ